MDVGKGRQILTVPCSVEKNLFSQSDEVEHALDGASGARHDWVHERQFQVGLKEHPTGETR